MILRNQWLVSVISELSDVSEHSEVSTDDVISQEHWDISSDEFEKDFGDVNRSMLI